jgi:hypothetical protein
MVAEDPPSNFPASLDDNTSLYLVEDGVTDVLDEHHNVLKNAIIALETKLGIDTSGVVTTIDYLLKNASSEDPGHTHSGASLDEASINHDTLLNFASNEHFTEASIDHTAITNIGTNSHATIDTHLASTANPHSVVWSDVSSGHDGTSHNTISLDDLVNTSLVDPNADRFIMWDDAPTGEYVFVQIDHTVHLTNVGTNSHATIDTHLASTANPHSVDWSDVSAGHTAGAHSGVGLNDLANTSLVDPNADRFVMWDDAPTGEYVFVQIDHTTHITNVGSNTHAQIDTHLGLTNEHINWAGASAGTIHTDNYIEGGAGTDTTAIHDDTSGEINAIADKASPVGADILIIEDSSASYAKKKVSITNLPGGADADAIHDNVAQEIQVITEKASPVGADVLIIEDSAASWNKKMVQITNLPGGADADAIHDNVANEITGITNKATPVAADEFLIEDSAATYVKKAVLFSALEGALDHTNILNIGTNAHSVIDTHLASTVNPHSVDWSDVSAGHDGTAHNSISLDDLANTTLTDPNADRFIMWDDAPTGEYVLIEIDHTTHIANVGTNTHATIDTHLAATSDPHSSTQTVTVKVVTPEIENSGNLTLDAINAAVDSTVYVLNSNGTYLADLDVEGDIIVGGTVDGLDIAGHAGGNQHIDWTITGNTIHTDNYIEGGAGTDTTAIHDNTASEISVITEKGAPVGADMLIIEDSEAANVKKMVQITNLPGGADADAIHDNVANEITAITLKTSLSSNDEFIIEDSDAAYVKKSTKLENIGSGLTLNGIGGELGLGQLAAGTQGGIIRRGAADWEEYAKGTENYALVAGATDVAWTQLDHTVHLSNIGSNSHATIDTHLSATTDPHGATLTQSVALNIQAATNQIVLDSDGTFTGTMTMATLATASRTWTFPDNTGTVLTDTGHVGSTHSSITFNDLAATNLADPGNDRILFWDDSATGSENAWLTPGDGIEIATTNLQLDIKADSGLVIDTGELSLKTTAVTAHYPVSTAVPYLDGAGNNVDMTPGHDATNHRNYWVVLANAADQDGDVVFEIFIPSDFQSLQTTCLEVWNYTDDTTNAGVTITVDDGTTEFNDTRQQNATWTQTAVTSTDVSSLTFTAGNTFIVRVKCDGDASDNIYVGSVEFHYNRD